MVTATEARRLLNISANLIHRKFKSKRVGNFFLKSQFLKKNEVALHQWHEQLEMKTKKVFATKNLRSGTYWALQENEFGPEAPGAKTWMSTHIPERETNIEFIRNAKGRVLIAGLGMGLILYPLSKLKGIRSVHVMEKNKEVIDLIRPYAESLGLEILISNQDIHKYEPPCEGFFHTIYFDIWPTIWVKNVIEIIQLKQKFKPYLAKDGWMGAWVEQELAKRASATKGLKRHARLIKKMMML